MRDSPGHHRQDKDQHRLDRPEETEESTPADPAEQALRQQRDYLDALVQERTAELLQINEQLRQEIAERIRVERALRRHEEHYALAQRAANVGSWEREVETGGLYWSEQTEVIFGFPPGGFPGTYEAFLACVHPEDRQAVIEAARNSLFKGKDYHFEHRIVRPDGTVRWVLEQGNTVWDEQGEAQRFTGVVQDITEQKQVHEHERYLRRVADSLREVSTILSSSLDLEVVLSKIFEELGRVIRYEGGAIFLVDGADLLLTKGIGAVAQRHVGERVPLDSLNPVARTFRSRQLLVINDGSREPYWMNWPHKAMIYAWIGALLRVDQEIIGVLAVDRYTPGDPYTPEDIQLLQTYANQAALAIHNARLYEALQASETRFRAVSELTSDYAYSLRVEPDQALVIEWFTPSSTAITGPITEMAAEPLRELLVHPEDLSLVEERTRKLLANQEDISEYRILTFQGQVRWVRDYSRPIWDQAAGRVVRIISAAQDITEQKQAEQALSESEQRYRLLAEHSHDAVALFEGGKVVYASPAYEYIHGYPVDLFIGIDFEGVLSVMHPDDRDYVESQMNRPDPVLKYAFRIKHREGHYVWVEDVVRRTFDEQGRPVRTIVNTRDISERKQLETQLYQAQKMDALGRLAGGVAHHFNNLLTGIIGYIELAIASLPPGHVAVSDLNKAYETSLRAASITQQLIAFTRHQMVRPGLFSLNDLVNRGQALLAQLIPVSITLTVSLGSRVGRVKINEGQFEQLLMNLVVNACEAMPEGGQVTIQTDSLVVNRDETVALGGLPPGRYARLTVSDTGMGISEAVQSRIFEPFFTTKDAGLGAGLGLSTCYGIVKQHGGEITISSQPGQGATFQIYLPRLEAE